VEGLRVVFARELQHLLAGDLVGAVDRLPPDLDILEIDHTSSVEAAPFAT
jgi:hypothetical protein